MRVNKVENKPVKPTRIRWTAIDVEESAIAKVRAYARVYNLTTGSALSEIINKAISDKVLESNNEIN